MPSLKQPLSERLRPRSFEDIFGHEAILSPTSWLMLSISNDTPLSILLYGTAGSGKTSIGKLYAKAFKGEHFFLSAVEGSISQVKKIIQNAKEHPLFSSKILIFIDEFHRFNKSQQDFFLPYVEEGSIILICATTENPSFAINNALLSRLRLLNLQPLDETALHKILDRCIACSSIVSIEENVRNFLVSTSLGDARHLVNCIENLELGNVAITMGNVASLLGNKVPSYDKNADSHYQYISALHKSIRASDPDASLYWLARCLHGGEDPLYICRRLIRIAIEDIGHTDMSALAYTLDGVKAYKTLGMPEGELSLASIVVYLALSPKSNAVYTAYKAVKEIAVKTSHFPPPKSLINPANAWMKKEGYGKGYVYDHDVEDQISGQNLYPENITAKGIYQPKEIGFEKQLKIRLLYFNKLREKKFIADE